MSSGSSRARRTSLEAHQGKFTPAREAGLAAAPARTARPAQAVIDIVVIADRTAAVEGMRRGSAATGAVDTGRGRGRVDDNSASAQHEQQVVGTPVVITPDRHQHPKLARCALVFDVPQ